MEYLNKLGKALEMGGRNRALHRSAMFQLSDKLSQPKPSENYSKIPS